MKKRLIITTLAVGALLASSAAPAMAHDRNGGKGHYVKNTIVDIAVAASGDGTPDDNPRDYDILIQALVATGLDKVLDDDQALYTVFAPNDRAFLRTVEDLTGKAPASEEEALTTITTAFTGEQISNILLYHVIIDKKLSSHKVMYSGKLTMANDGVVKPRGDRLKDETPDVRDPRLVFKAVDIKASNGIIHTIDRVLLPGMI